MIYIIITYLTSGVIVETFKIYILSGIVKIGQISGLFHDILVQIWTKLLIACQVTIIKVQNFEFLGFELYLNKIKWSSSCSAHFKRFANNILCSF